MFFTHLQRGFLVFASVHGQRSYQTRMAVEDKGRILLPSSSVRDPWRRQELRMLESTGREFETGPKRDATCQAKGSALYLTSASHLSLGLCMEVRRRLYTDVFFF